MPPSLVLVLFLGLAAAPSPRPAPALAAGLQAGGEQDAWRALVERDRRVARAPLTGDMALAALEDEERGSQERAAALFALGWSGRVVERSRIAGWAESGTLKERQAATLALGELGPGSTPLLIRLAREEGEPLAGCALLALLRSGQPDAVGYVSSVAATPDAALSELARALIAFQRDPSSAPASDPARRWLELRYEAAKGFGLIDGKTWRVLLYEGLAEDEAFLDPFVFGAARRLREPGFHDHLLMAVLEGEGEQALRAAVSVIPTELAQLVATGLWVPRGEQWTTLLEEIEEQRVETLCEPLLLQAMAIQGLEGWSAFLLLRGGNLRGRPILERSLQDASASTRRRVAEGLGETGDRSWLGWLSTFVEDPDEEVRAAALVAQARLGHAGARTTLEILLVNEELARRQVRQELLVAALARASGSSEMLFMLEDALPDLSGATRVEAAIALALAGRDDGIEIVRAQLRSTPPRGPQGVRLVRALGRFPTASDVELLSSYFPLDEDIQVNVALAEVLLEAKAPAVVMLLRSALWRPPVNRSLLAAALVVDSAGIGTLRRELQSSPRTAREGDLRRVGFALGALGGLREVEELSKGWGVGHPGLQGAVLGALAARTR